MGLGLGVPVRKEGDTGRKPTWTRGHVRTAQGNHLCFGSSGEITFSRTMALCLIIKKGGGDSEAGARTQASGFQNVTGCKNLWLTTPPMSFCRLKQLFRDAQLGGPVGSATNHLPVSSWGKHSGNLTTAYLGCRCNKAWDSVVCHPETLVM